MSETLPEGVTRKDFEALQASVKELADALNAKNDAETATERQEAHADVVEARADLDQLAKELGVSPAKLREAADKAKRDEEKERLRPLLVELLDEEMTPASDPLEPDEPAADDPPADDAPAAEPAPEPVVAPEDSAPTQEHWSERKVGLGLFGR